LVRALERRAPPHARAKRRRRHGAADRRVPGVADGARPGTDRRDRPRGRLRADRRRDRARLRRAPDRQLRVRAADHDRRLHARLHPGVGRRGRDPDRRRRRGVRVAGDGAGRVSAAADDLAGDGARRHVRDQLPAPEPRTAPLHVPEPAGRRLRRRPRRPQPCGRARVAARPLDHVRRDRRRRGLASGARPAPQPHRPRPADARRRRRLPDRPPPRRAREHGDHGRGRRQRVARGRGGRDPLGAEPADHEHDRPERDDLRARRRRRRRDEPAALRDSGRLRDRVRELVPRLRARHAGVEQPDRAAVHLERLPALADLRARDPRPAAAARRALRAARPGGRGAGVRRLADTLAPLAGPALLVVLLAVVASQTVNASDDVRFRTAIVNVALVVALYVFVGNSGVLSFGQISFVAVGAFAAGLLTVPADVKPGVLPDLSPFLKDHSISNAWSLVLAAGLGALYALLVGVPLMRLSGLAAGIATFAVLGITYNILTYWTRIGPGATTLTLIPVTTDYVQATVGAVVVIAIAYAYQRS